MNSNSSRIQLDSISLFCEDQSLLKGPPVYKSLPIHFGKYKSKKLEAAYSPILGQLPMVFAKPLKAYAEPGLSEIALLNRLSQMVRYNFSDGTQVSAQEIYRSTYQAFVSTEWLPRPEVSEDPFMSWPLLEGIRSELLTPDIEQLTKIIQALLKQVISAHNKKKIDLYLQTAQHPDRALKLTSVEFDPNQEFSWRVDFSERPHLKSEFALIGIRKVPLNFYTSFALDEAHGVLIVHSWDHELRVIQEELLSLSHKTVFYDREMPKFELKGEFEIKTMIRFLRKRGIGLLLEGLSKHIPPQQSQTEIHLRENGYFFIQHAARRTEQKSVERRGFTARSQLLLQTLAEGIGFILRSEIKDVASRDSKKRDWDLKLLKHNGILHFVTFEVLKHHFASEQSDFAKFDREDLFLHLHTGIKSRLLDKGSFAAFGHQALTELCSNSAVRAYENFVDFLFSSLSESEAYYTEHGEIVLEGIVEREFQIIFELLKNRLFEEGFEIFQKSKFNFAKSVSNFDDWKEMNSEVIEFIFSKNPEKLQNSIAVALEVGHSLKLSNFSLLYKDQVVQELQDHQFKIDFALTGDAETKNLNWFELDPSAFLDGTPVDIDDLIGLKGQRLIEHNGKSYLLPKSQLPLLGYLELFWLKLQREESKPTPAHQKRRAKPAYHVDRHQMLELLSLRARGVQLRGDHHWKELCDFYDQLGRHPEMPCPHGVCAELKHYQLQGMKWLYDLYRLRLSALLADEMGLGKTLQALSFLQQLKNENRLQKVLVIVPSSLVFNWRNEARKFTPDLAVTLFSQKDQLKVGRKLESTEDTIVVTSYGLLVEHQQFLTQYNWNVIIFDEAQNLKNINTRRTKAARTLRANFKLALTGTPMENNYAEFYSLMDLLLPGCLGKLDDFRRKFVNTDLITQQEMNHLRSTLQPVILRRTKKHIALELPEKQETRISIAFDSEQRQIYRDIAISYNEQVKDVIATRQGEVHLRMLTALLRLRQACSDPSALPNVHYNRIPPKVKTLVSALQEISASGNSALVFTQFLQTMRNTEEMLQKAGLSVLTLHGGLSTQQKQKLLENFETSSEPQILLMTMKTGGVGLNLTKASYVFHLEPWWNPAVENQATDRAHRLGQTKKVQVFRYVMHDSLEEKIELLKDRKNEKFHALLGESTSSEESFDAGSNALSKSDFDLLLGMN